MIAKLPKRQYDVVWKDFFAERNITFLSESVSEDGVYLKMVEDPAPEVRLEIEEAITVLGNKIYWSDDGKAGNIFEDSIK
jgi:hypothetical protein